MSRLLPEDGVIRKVGGPDYRYYVEVDGDDSDLDGRNMVSGAEERPWFDAGMWRIEIQPQEERSYDEFLVLLQPSLAGQPEPPPGERLQAGHAIGVRFSKAVILFARRSAREETIAYPVQSRDHIVQHILVDLPPQSMVRLGYAGEYSRSRASKAGTLIFNTPAGYQGQVTVEVE